MTATPVTASGPRRWLRAVVLDRKETLSWAMYDWANSAFATTVMAAVLPIYYASVAASNLPDNIRSAYWGYTNSLALLIIALLAPVLGAVADYMGAKKRFMGIFLMVGVLFTALLYFITQGEWLLASVLFIVANIGFAGANVFYDSLLPHIASDEEIDRLSTAGYALGYLGGGILLIINLLWILQPELFGISDTTMASRLAMFSVAVWWAIFSVPLFRNVPEPPRRVASIDRLGANPVRAGFSRLQHTFQEIRKYRQLLIFLIAFLFYNDGISTIIKMATVYGTEIGIDQSALIGALVLTQFVGIPFSFAFGWLAHRIGSKRSIYLALTVYMFISIGGYFMAEAWHFWALALAVATVQGGSQALSRSLYGSMVPRSQSSEFFGFFSVSSKFAGIMGPLLFAVVAQLAGSSRLSIVSLLVFFIGGMLILTQVDIEEGQRVARLEDRQFEIVPRDA
ncbi:MAG: MFS transporter [Chloroflexota bacterium]|nr:MFS transporter [Chloroflexota bacterium]